MLIWVVEKRGETGVIFAMANVAQAQKIFTSGDTGSGSLTH